VDEYRIMVFPIILGGGMRMFPDSMPDPASLTLSEARTVGTGVQLLTLHPAPAEAPAAG
jgi:dihydrofolate reductase